MVCEKCEKKLGTVITPDTWKDGARNTTESGGRKLNENKALTSKKARFDPYGKNKFSTCRICKSSVHQPGSHYCQGCAYKKAQGLLDSVSEYTLVLFLKKPNLEVTSRSNCASMESKFWKETKRSLEASDWRESLMD
ncbi:PREDICTED: cysteine-rich PDZ-binding protein [Colobus angolensis palliatus]|uniref:cysteine-rich PDZ-binding protein n=1 Tax=Colobus angolensis palliatus TaxID=336983 RepID=UPI0005F3D43C|nr:PREDICTED: cysteine-rich PDZ-binding protein [Colobus angolensis palliatus]